jgi:hypothetical protein
MDKRRRGETRGGWEPPPPPPPADAVPSLDIVIQINE